MNKITIEIEVSNFGEIVKRQGKNYCFERLKFAYLRLDSKSPLKDRLIKDVRNKTKEFYQTGERVLFISILLEHLSLATKEEEIIEDLDAMDLVQDLQHMLVGELDKLRIGVDKNAFTTSEIKDLTKKVNQIISTLDKMVIGQEIIFDRVEELKQDYADLLRSFGLGKKPFYQRLAGIVMEYSAEKGADEVIEAIKPHLHNIGLKMIDNAIKLIG